MPDEQQQPEQQDAGRDAQSDAQQGESYDVAGYTFDSLEDAANIIGALSKRVGERDSKINNLSERLSEIEAARKKQLEQSGNYEQIAKERMAELEALKPVAERARALEEVIRESNERRIEEIPEGMRPLIPTDYAPEKLQTWLNENQSLLTKPTAPDSNAGAGRGGGRSTQSNIDPDLERRMRQFGLSAEDINKVRRDNS